MPLAVFPANVHAAREHLSMAGRQVENLLTRKLLQVVFLAATVTVFRQDIDKLLARAGNHHQRLGTEAKRSDFGSRSQTCGGKIMSRESRMLAGILLVVLPTVMFGGLSLLSFLTRNVPGYGDNPLRHDLWRAGHAHAGVYLVLSLVLLRYVDDAVLSPFWKWLARTGAPIAAILIPAAFFLSVAAPTAKQPNALINLAYVGAVFLAAAVISLGVGLIRAGQTDRERHESSTVTAE